MSSGEEELWSDIEGIRPEHQRGLDTRSLEPSGSDGRGEPPELGGCLKLAGGCLLTVWLPFMLLFKLLAVFALPVYLLALLAGYSSDDAALVAAATIPVILVSTWLVWRLLIGETARRWISGLLLPVWRWYRRTVVWLFSFD